MCLAMMQLPPLLIEHSTYIFVRIRTIHGRSRYPGLHVWGRNTGKRIAVKVPPGRYLLVQAGKQLEVSYDRNVLSGTFTI